jgi:c-di-GMP-binding flagellar brake protein YcgR
MTTWVPVRLLDLSRGGALLASSRAIHLPPHAELRTAFEGDPFHATIEVRRVRTEGQGAAAMTGLGVCFLDLDDSSRKALTQFLRRTLP